MSKDLSKNEVNTEDVVEAAAEKKAKKPVAKKPNIFKRIWKKIVKLCKDTVGEMKKVVWPTRKEVFNNTGVVMGVMIIVALFLFGVDTGLGAVITKILEIGS